MEMYGPPLTGTKAQQVRKDQEDEISSGQAPAHDSSRGSRSKTIFSMNIHKYKLSLTFDIAEMILIQECWMSKRP